jgi:hypothetical protein
VAGNQGSREPDVSIEEALNAERNERLTAERAYELYWADLLNPTPRFTCIGHDCTAPLICACLDKPEQNLRIRPYFRSRRIEDHAATCEIAHGRDEAKTEKRPDVFEAERPAGHFHSLPAGSKPEPAASDPLWEPLQRRSRGSGPGFGEHPIADESAPTRAGSGADARAGMGTAPGAGLRARSRHYYRLSSLVQKFLEHRRDKDLAEALVEIGGETSTYEALFRNVYRQKAADQLNTRAIWWGTASLRATKEGGYYLRFSRPFRHDDIELKPTITLTAKEIDAYPVRKLLRARLDKIITEADGYCVVFVWAKPWMPKDAEKPFVRFYVNNLDHIDVRGPEILEELKNTSRISD